MPQMALLSVFGGVVSVVRSCDGGLGTHLVPYSMCIFAGQSYGRPRRSFCRMLPLTGTGSSILIFVMQGRSTILGSYSALRCSLCILPHCCGLSVGESCSKDLFFNVDQCSHYMFAFAVPARSPASVSRAAAMALPPGLFSPRFAEARLNELNLAFLVHLPNILHKLNNQK